MTTREEFAAAVEQLDQAVTQMALVAMAFRRLYRDLWPDPKPPDEVSISEPWTTK